MAARPRSTPRDDWMAWRRRMETRTAKIEATLPQLATKADLQAVQRSAMSLIKLFLGVR